MKYYFTVTFILLAFTNISAQQLTTNFSAGIGVKYNIFDSNEVLPFEFVNDFSPHFNFQLDIKRNKKSGFNGIIQLNLLSKKISFGETYQLPNSGQIVEGFTHEFLSAELLIATGFDIPTKHFMIQPELGFCFAFNQYIGLNYFNRISGNAVVNTQISNWVFETEKAPFFIYPSIIFGVELERQFLKKPRRFILFFDTYLTPVNIFTDPFNYQVNGDNFELQGKYHYLNLGLRIGINTL